MPANAATIDAMTDDEQQAAFDREFARCAPWLQAALDEGDNTHTLEDIRAAVLAQYMQFWPAERGAAITEVVSYPRSKTLHIFLAGGELDQIVDMEASAARFARAVGCNQMTVAGRRGWLRVLGDQGYKESLTLLSKEL